jgi:hypothetical protein
MRCEGAENPPCKRCRQQSLECLFEKPNREASLTGEAGLECVLHLPSSVLRSFIVLGGYGAWRHTLRIYGSLKRPFKTAWWKSLTTCARGQQAQSAPLPLSLLRTYILLRMSMRIHLRLCQRPSLRAQHLTPAIPSSCPLPNQAQQCVPLHLSRSSSFDSVKQMYGSPSIPAMRTNGDGQTSQVPQGSTAYQPMGSQYHIPPGVPPTLPPLSSMEHTGPARPPPDNLSSVRHQHTDSSHPRHFDKQPSVLSGSVAGKRPFPVSTETSADSSDEEEDGGELPASGLVAPWEVLRGLADVAIQRAAKVSQNEHPYHLFTPTAIFAGEWRRKRGTESYKIALSRSQITEALQEAEVSTDAPRS